MKVGDLVQVLNLPEKSLTNRFGIIMNVDNSHRQCIVDVLFCTGLKRNIWVAHLEAINESR